MEESWETCLTQQTDLESFLNFLESEHSMMGQYEFNDLVKESLLKITQLYFDGLIENNKSKRNPSVWREQSGALNSLLTGLILAVGDYYVNEKIRMAEVNELISPFQEILVKYGSASFAKHRHLESHANAVKKCALEVKDLLEDKVDVIVPIASGGFEPAALIANYLGVDDILPLRYSYVDRGDKKIKMPHHASDNYFEVIRGKRVLVVEDIIFFGKTFLEVSKFIAQYKPLQTCYSFVITPYEEFMDELGAKQVELSEFLYTI